MDEHALFKTLRKEGKTPSPTDNRLRLGFWLEYERAIGAGRNMVMQNVFAGVCTVAYFYREYLASPTRVAWILCPPVEYEVKIKEALDHGIGLLRSYLDIDAAPEGGPTNIKLMELQAKIVSMMDQRLKGGYTQRAENKTLSLSVSASGVGAAATELSMEALEKRLKQIEKLERKAQNAGEIEVKSEVEVKDGP